MRIIDRYKRYILVKRFKKTAIEWLFRGKSLASKGERRLRNVILGLSRLKYFEERHGGLTLSRDEKMRNAIKGLIGFKEGSESGFATYEGFKTEQLLKELISES